MLNEIKTQLEEYQLSEGTLNALKLTLADKKADFEKENLNLINNIKDLSEKQEMIKNLAKEKAIEEFKLTGNKKLSFGLGIRVGTELLYDLDIALDWAKEHKLCLKLDEKAFEGLAKTQNLDFVTKEEKVSATFPTKLELNEQ